MPGILDLLLPNLLKYLTFNYRVGEFSSTCSTPSRGKLRMLAFS